MSGALTFGLLLRLLYYRFQKTRWSGIFCIEVSNLASFALN